MCSRKKKAEETMRLLKEAEDMEPQSFFDMMFPSFE
jgi:hypothetical protein